MIVSLPQLTDVTHIYIETQTDTGYLNPMLYIILIIDRFLFATGTVFVLFKC